MRRESGPRSHERPEEGNRTSRGFSMKESGPWEQKGSSRRESGPQRQRHLEEGNQLLLKHVCNAKKEKGRSCRIYIRIQRSAFARGKGRATMLVKRGICIYLVEHGANMDLPHHSN